MDKLKDLKEVLFMINEGSVTKQDLQVFITTILEFAKRNKENFSKIEQETKDSIIELFNQVISEHEKLSNKTESTINASKNELEKISKKLSDTFETKIEKVQAILDEIKSIEVSNGKDADENRIIENVLAKIKLPSQKEKSIEDIVTEINDLPVDPEYQIDAKHIKNIQTGTFYGGAGIKQIIQGNNITVDNTNPDYPVVSSTGSSGGAVDDINGITGSVTLSPGTNMSLNQVGQDIEFNANFTQMGKYMISGGATWSGTGLTYDVSFLTYFFNGNKTANPTSVTLAASDPTNNRFDSIVVDEAGVVTVITGTPSSSPEVPPIPEDQLGVTVILVEAGSTTPTVATEEIYMDDPTTNWTFSTYTTGTPTGSINFAGTNTPKQGTECIEASTDARLGARFVRGTSFDAFQYTMLQVWVRFTGTAVATNKSLNVRFENSAGTLVANTVNLFNYGLQRGVLNTWQLVVVPITAFGALPATVKGLKMIMAGGTVGVVRQWDIDYMILTNGSVPYANVPTIAFYKDDVGIASQSGLNLIEGTGVTIDAVNNPLYNRVDYTLNATGGSPGGSQYNVQINDGAGGFSGSNNFLWSPSAKTLQVGDVTGTGNQTKLRLTDANNLFEIYGLRNTIPPSTTTPVFTGSGLDDFVVANGSSYSGLTTTSYSITIDRVNADIISFSTSSISGSGFVIGETVTSSSGGSATIDAINLNSSGVYTYLVLSGVTGTFLQTDVITGGTSSTTATLDSDLGQQDTFSWTDGTNSGSLVIAKMFQGALLSNSLIVYFDISTGHTLADNWTFDGVPGSTTYGKMLNLDGANKTVDIGDVDGITGGMDIRFNNSYTFPKLDGTSGQVLVTDGAGTVSFSDIPEQAIGGSFSGVGTATTTFTVTIPTQGGTSYQVTATPSNILSAAVFYINNKTTTSFDVVYLTGLTGTVEFDWILKP